MSSAIVEAGQQERPSGALVPQDRAGTLAMAVMPDEEFQQRLAALKKGQERIRTIKRELMEDGAHYGTIPGTDKPTLLKPGSEVLLSIYNLRPDFIPNLEYGDGSTAPAVRVSMRCELHMRDLAGPVVGVGYGSANSWERKHRYRRAERACPKCGAVGTVIKGKADFGGGWLCWAKKGGCGVKYPDGAPEIVQQAVEDVENPDQHDLENTLVKMAEKRAQIDATLRATASSDLFTQDLEEQAPTQETEERAKPERPRPSPTECKHPAIPPSRIEQLAPGKSLVCPDCGTEFRRERQPGDDDIPPATPPRREVEPPARSASKGKKPPCPQCNSSREVIVSKKPENGAYYCFACRAGFDA